MTKREIERSQGKTLGNLYLGVLDAGVSKEDAIALISAIVAPKTSTPVDSGRVISEFFRYLERVQNK